MEKHSFSIKSSLPEINKVNDAFDALLSEKLNDKLVSERKIKFIEEFKVISYELFSNCIIHNESPTICYETVFNSGMVELIVYSQGKGFNLKPIYNNENNLAYHAPFPDSILDKTITVYEGIDSKVDCVILNNNRLKFQVTNLENPSFETDTLPEHFGLFLIASLTDSFEYSRSDNGVDTYKILKLII
jgi:anti-sigma regulatory factor (Ser/Thr protein kinase)